MDGLLNQAAGFALRALAGRHRKMQSGVKLPVTEGGTWHDQSAGIEYEQYVPATEQISSIGHLTTSSWPAFARMQAMTVLELRDRQVRDSGTRAANQPFMSGL